MAQTESRQQWDQFREKVRAFIETATLYSPEQFEFPGDDGITQSQLIGQTLPNAITYPCNTCKAEECTTWALKKIDPWAVYECVLCKKDNVAIWLTYERFNEKETANGIEAVIRKIRLTKMGQRPQWSMPVSKRMRKTLGDSLPLFQKALACMAEGLGIGAAAYLRRLIEEKTAALLDLVEHTSKLENDERTLKNLAEARLARDATERLRIAAQQLPSILRPGDQNPLRIFYSSMSGPLHSESEESALELAHMLLDSLVFLFENLEAQLEAAEQFRENMKAAGERLGKLKRPS
jgi:hypothetical protein